MKLQLSRFMSHEASEIDLPPKGVVLVTGPNGAGKSAVIEGIATAMWGRGLRSRWSPWRNGKAGRVRLVDGGLDVSRGWDGKAKTKLAFGRSAGEKTEFDTTTKAQESLDSVIGSFEVWRRTCVFSAADAAHFTMATDAERKELLENLLGLGWFDRALASCRRDLQSARTLQGQATREVELAVSKLDGLASGISSNLKIVEGLPPMEDVGLLRVEITRLSNHLKDVATEYLDLQKRLHELAGAGGEDKERAASIKSRLAKLQSAHCYACGQEVDGALRDQMQQEAEAALAAARTKVSAVLEEGTRIQGEMNELHEEAEVLRKLDGEARTKLQEIEGNRIIHGKLRRSMEEQGEQMSALAKKVNAQREKLTAIAVDVAELEACEQILGVRGARAHIVGRTLSSIETLANVWLTRLCSNIEIKLSPYTEKKSGSVVDSISLTLTGVGGEGGYLGASAGERRRVDVALLLSLAELASGTNNGAAWRSPIFFDEVFDSLDVDGREAVVDLVRQLAADRCVVLITHDEGLGLGYCDVRIRIDGGVVS